MQMDQNKVRLGIAPIAWTNDDMPELGMENTFEQCISEMALAGYRGSEVGNKYPRDPKTLNRYLHIRGLEICNGWFSTFFTEGKKEETIQGFVAHMEFLQQCGAKVIGCSEQGGSIQGLEKPIFGHKPVFTEDQWQLLAEGMNMLGDIAEESGMKVCLHHHMGTGIQTPVEIDIFMEKTNENVYLLFDTGHIYFSENSQEAVDRLIDRYIDRIVHVHLKDIRPEVLNEVRESGLSFLDGVRRGVFTVPGDGCIDFTTTFAKLHESGYEGYMVVEAEQDPAVANPFEYAVKARRFIRNMAGI